MRLSPVPLRIGVVTSVGTAAWHDFRHELEQSAFGFSLAVCDVRVQGEFAAAMVAAGIGTLGRRRDLDAIVVIRGGGAKNELAVFDSELIARTIAAAGRPVLTGLGPRGRPERRRRGRPHRPQDPHRVRRGVDRTGRARIVPATEEAWSAIRRRSTTALGTATGGLSDLAHRIARRTHAAVERSDERLSMRVDRLVRCGPTVLADGTRRLDACDVQVTERPRGCCNVRPTGSTCSRRGCRRSILRCSSPVAGRSPAAPTARSSARSTTSPTGSTITTSIVDGSISSTVRATTPIEGPAT